MPVIKTVSATPLDRITLETGRSHTTHVWLRENITQKEEEFDGESHDVWEADEVYLHLGTPITASYVEDHFEELWMRGLAREEAVTLETLVADLYVAVGELGALVAGGDE